MVLDGGILGALHQQRSPPVRLEQPSGLADAHLGVYVRLYENGEMPHIAGKKLSQFLHQTRHISLYFTIVIQTYAFVKEFHFFCEDSAYSERIGFEFQSSYRLIPRALVMTSLRLFR